MPRDCNGSCSKRLGKRDDHDVNDGMTMKKADKTEGGLRTSGELKGATPEMPLVSVITVVYNGDRHLEQTIRSVLGQTYRNIEYLVIDGGSTDKTLDIVSRYEDRIDYWISEPDNGIYDAMNKGIELAGGDLIGLINSDDYYEPDALQAVADKYLSGTFPQILYGNTYMLHVDLNVRYKAYSHTRYWLGMGICHPAMFVHKDVYKTAGKYDLNYRIAADFDFMVKALKKEIPFVSVEKFLVNYRVCGFSAVNFPSTLRENRKIIKKYSGLFSMKYWLYSILYFKSMTLIALEKIINILFGNKILNKARSWYLRRFIASESEPIL